MASSSTCNEVTEACPVSATVYGYIPSLAGNTTIDTVFGLALLVHIVLMALPPKTKGIRHRHWPYSIIAFIGITLEFVGYLSRIWMIGDVWNEAAVGVQFICLILGPAFLVSAMYLVFSHLAREIGPQYGRLPAKYYTWVFVTFDGCMLLQALGSGLAAAQTSSAKPAFVKAGSDIILVGIVLQVVVMVVVCGLVVEYVYRWRKTSNLDRILNGIGEDNQEVSPEYPQGSQHRLMLVAALVGVAYILILIRSIYRIAEFASGWDGPAMRTEAPFLVLDGAMVALATVCLTIAHPALLFPEMCRR
jgi:small-conductance mechanosensitive channel